MEVKLLLILLTIGIQVSDGGKILKKLSKELKKVIGNGVKFEDFISDNIAELAGISEDIAENSDQIHLVANNITVNSEKIHSIAENITIFKADVTSNSINIANNTAAIASISNDVKIATRCTATNWDYNCCTSANPCGLNQGDCDNDDECYGDLKCGTDNCIGFNDSGADCCILVGIHQNALGIANNAVDISNIKVDVANNLANITKNAMDIASHLSSHGTNPPPTTMTTMTTATTTPGNSSCPLSNPNYKVISGTCYYIEDTTTFNYEDAQLFCQNKFGNLVGGLFEPRLFSTNQLVYAEALNFASNIGDDFWLGINDLATQGQYVYASDGQEVVDGMWVSGQPSSSSERCVGYLDILSYDSNGGWWDRPCSGYKFPICQPIGGMTPEKALLLVATGNDQNLSSNNDPVNSCEVIDMANSTTSCSNLPIYPQTLKQAAGQVLDSTPIIIGGHSPSGYHDQVYKFDYISNSWQQLGSLAKPRSMHASVIMNGGIWIMGGYNYPGTSTEIIYSNGTITAGPELPSDLGAGPCAIALETGLIIIMGGQINGYNTTYYNPVTGAYVSGPNMLNDHESLACAHFHSDRHNGRPVILSAGGKSTSKAEIYDYTTGGAGWEQIDDLPSPYASTHNGPRGVTSVDGKGAYVQQNYNFFRLSCDTSSCSWSVMTQTLDEGRDSSVLMYLPPGYNCSTTTPGTTTPPPTTVTTTTPGNSSCPLSNPNYVAIAGSCYYFEDTTPMTYAEAQQNCQNKFGTLVGKLFEPRLANTNQLVNAVAANFVSGTSNDFWLGINDLATQGQYVYASDGATVVSGMWSPSQPSSSSERCVAYYNMPTYGGQWYDRPCDYPSYSICQQT